MKDIAVYANDGLERSADGVYRHSSLIMLNAMLHAQDIKPYIFHKVEDLLFFWKK
jgi:hypothetical protein